MRAARLHVLNSATGWCNYQLYCFPTLKVLTGNLSLLNLCIPHMLYTYLLHSYITMEFVQIITDHGDSHKQTVIINKNGRYELYEIFAFNILSKYIIYM